MPANYPDWVEGVTPRGDERATATRTRSVAGVPAIRVRDATYRQSRPIDGIFELVSTEPQSVAGEDRYEVYCAWFGVKPPTKYPRISVRPGGYELLPSYTGLVIDNLSDGPAPTPVVAATMAPVSRPLPRPRRTP